jgi:hypothetical protein
MKIEYEYAGQVHSFLVPHSKAFARKVRFCRIFAVFDGRRIEITGYPGTSYPFSVEELGISHFEIERNDEILKIYSGTILDFFESQNHD